MGGNCAMAEGHASGLPTAPVAHAYRRCSPTARIKHRSPWYGMVWYGMVWHGMAWYAMTWYGMAWCGKVW